MKRSILLSCVAALAGCASVSDVVPIGANSYMVGSSSMGGTKSHTEVKALAIRRANEFCQEKGRVMVLQTTESSGVRGWTPMGSEVTFICAASDSQAASEPVILRKTPDTVIEVNKR